MVCLLNENNQIKILSFSYLVDDLMVMNNIGTNEILIQFNQREQIFNISY